MEQPGNAVSSGMQGVVGCRALELCILQEHHYHPIPGHAVPRQPVPGPSAPQPPHHGQQTVQASTPQMQEDCCVQPHI